MLVTLTDVLKHCMDKPYAVPAFNIFGYEDAKAVIDAAEELQAPVILATNKVAIAHIPIHILGKMLVQLAEDATVPVVVHLDHGSNYDTIAQALRAGYSSVMYDGSQLPLTENIENTKEIVKMSHAFGVSIEAEIGSVGYTDISMGMKHIYTDPKEAEQFAQQTGVDALAVAVGTLHRMEEQTAQIQYDLINEIEEVVNVPLVLHGSTGVPDEDLQKIAETNFGKVNIGTALRMAFGETVRKSIHSNPNIYDRMDIFPYAMNAVREVAKEKIKLLRADEFNTFIKK